MPEPNVSAASDGPDDFEQIGDDKTLRRMLRFDGEVRSLTEWARLYGISKYTLCNRLKYGWTIERAITEPTKMRTRTGKAVRKIREQIDPEKLKPEERLEPAAIRQAARLVLERMGKLSPHEQLLQLEREFGERKFQACKRLIKEQRIEPFRTRCRAYAAATKGLRLSKHIVFYLALSDFPPVDLKG